MMINNEPFIKVIYESDPIGKEKIILKLTTFDDSFDKIINEYKSIEINKYDKNDSQWIQHLEEILNNTVELHYRREILRLKNEIDNLKYLVSYGENKYVNNVTNCSDIHVQTIHGDVTNCGDVYVNHIYGKVTNCDIHYELFNIKDKYSI